MTINEHRDQLDNVAPLTGTHSPYSGSTISLATMHQKSSAIAPSFMKHLSAEVIECSIDTDKLGTFTGEIQREGSAIECARKKCELGISASGAYFGLSSEGCFGPHPFIPFIPCDQEFLYFIDTQRDFHLHVSCISEKTNYRMQTVQSIEELLQFAEETHFPSHGLILRPSHTSSDQPIVKGITDMRLLTKSFDNLLKYAADGKVRVETDMRAHMNPLRGLVISELAENLAKRLSVLCPQCATPGWGVVGIEKGLECAQCGLKTELCKSEIYGCAKCDHQQYSFASNQANRVDPRYCAFCNP